MQNSKLSTRVLSTRVPYDYYIKIVGLAKDNKMTVSDYVALIIHSPEEKKSFKDVPVIGGSPMTVARIRELMSENQKLQLENDQLVLRVEGLEKMLAMEIEDGNALRRQKLNEAFELLWNGKFIRLNNGVLIDITDILSREVLDSQTKEKSEKEIHEFLSLNYGC